MTDEKDTSEKKAPIPFSTPEMVELEAQAALTRLELVSTVDALAQRLDPRAGLHQATDQAKAQADKARDAAQQLWHDATSADADPEASTRARVVLASAAAVVALAVAAAAFKRRG